MRKLTLFFSLFVSFGGYTQITLDFQSSVPHLHTVKLSNTVTKYSRDFNNADSISEFALYNLDGTLFKTIHLPPKPYDTSIVYYISNITTSLFDNDPSNIEYLINYLVANAGSSFSVVQVVREDGTIFLNESYASSYFWPSDFDNASIYKTEEGVKLRLYYYNNGAEYTKVFSLPGEIPTNISNDPSLTYIDALIFPNPNNGFFTIDLQSNDGESSTIDLYSSTGKLINSFTSTKKCIFLEKPGLQDGLYIIKTQSSKKFSSTKLIIKK